MGILFVMALVGCDQVDRGDDKKPPTTVTSLIMVLWRRGGGDLGLCAGKRNGMETGNPSQRPKWHPGVGATDVWNETKTVTT